LKYFAREILSAKRYHRIFEVILGISDDSKPVYLDCGFLGYAQQTKTTPCLSFTESIAVNCENNNTLVGKMPIILMLEQMVCIVTNELWRVKFICTNDRLATIPEMISKYVHRQIHTFKIIKNINTCI
jgi:hypothetical protein